jgi:hypothetical protein
MAKKNQSTIIIIAKNQTTDENYFIKIINQGLSLY